MNLANDTCDRYWDDADWLPPGYILDRWCQQDGGCRHAKQQALLTACERGDVHYRRSDGKTFDDPVYELSARGILLVERESFDAWATGVEGRSPLSVPARPIPPLPRPAWADNAWKPSALPPDPEPSTAAINGAEAEEAPVDDDESDGGSDQLHGTATDIPSVPSSAIIDAFRIKDSDTDNAQWWDQRMRDAKRYGLINARTAKGQLQNQSYWRPDLIACWLVDKHHLSAKTVKRIVLHHFPDWADTLDYLGD
jgi:hypothetical protein